MYSNANSIRDHRRTAAQRNEHLQALREIFTRSALGTSASSSSLDNRSLTVIRYVPDSKICDEIFRAVGAKFSTSSFRRIYKPHVTMLAPKELPLNTRLGRLSTSAIESVLSSKVPSTNTALNISPNGVRRFGVAYAPTIGMTFSGSELAAEHASVKEAMNDTARDTLKWGQFIGHLSVLQVYSREMVAPIELIVRKHIPEEITLGLPQAVFASEI